MLCKIKDIQHFMRYVVEGLWQDIDKFLVEESFHNISILQRSLYDYFVRMGQV